MSQNVCRSPTQSQPGGMSPKRRNRPSDPLKTGRGQVPSTASYEDTNTIGYFFFFPRGRQPCHQAPVTTAGHQEAGPGASARVRGSLVPDTEPCASQEAGSPDWSLHSQIFWKVPGAGRSHPSLLQPVREAAALRQQRGRQRAQPGRDRELCPLAQIHVKESQLRVPSATRSHSGSHTGEALPSDAGQEPPKRVSPAQVLSTGPEPAPLLLPPQNERPAHTSRERLTLSHSGLRRLPWPEGPATATRKKPTPSLPVVPGRSLQSVTLPALVLSTGPVCKAPGLFATPSNQPGWGAQAGRPAGRSQAPRSRSLDEGCPGRGQQTPGTAALPEPGL